MRQKLLLRSISLSVALAASALLLPPRVAPLVRAEAAQPTYTSAVLVNAQCGDSDLQSCSGDNSSILDQAARDCGLSETADLNADDPQQADCILAALRAGGASDQAQKLFTDTHLLLKTFVHIDGLGPIDVGVATVPWVNMNRGQIVFLNGNPSAVSLFSIVGLPKVFLRMPDHDALVHRYPGVGPWFEYSEVGISQPMSDGGEMIVLNVPLKLDRPSPPVAWMPLEFTFDAGGTLVSVDPLASEAQS
jgi:hypothetical protein